MADPLGRVKVGGVTNAENSLNSLLAGEELLSMQQVADKLGLPITRAYDLLQDRKFIVWDSPEGKRVPLAFFNDKGSIAKHVTGVITVLTDGGYDDEEILRHLAGPSTPCTGTWRARLFGGRRRLLFNPALGELRAFLAHAIEHPLRCGPGHNDEANDPEPVIELVVAVAGKAQADK